MMSPLETADRETLAGPDPAAGTPTVIGRSPSRKASPWPTAAKQSIATLSSHYGGVGTSARTALSGALVRTASSSQLAGSGAPCRRRRSRSSMTSLAVRFEDSISTQLFHRYYDPATEQFLSVDPLVDMTGAPYAYTSGDPVNESDQTGDVTCPTFVPGCGVVTDVQNGVSGAVQRAASFVYRYSSDIATVSSILAAATIEVPGVGEVFGGIAIASGASEHGTRHRR